MVIETSLLKDITLTNLYPFWERIKVNTTSFKCFTWAAQGCPENVRNRVSEHNVLQRMLLDMFHVMFHSSTMRKSRYERPSPQLTSPVSTVTDLSPHFRFEKQIKTVQTWCFCTKKKNDWSWGLLMENLKYWLLIGRANLILTNGLSFTVCSQPFKLFWVLKLKIGPPPLSEYIR